MCDKKKVDIKKGKAWERERKEEENEEKGKKQEIKWR